MSSHLGLCGALGVEEKQNDAFYGVVGTSWHIKSLLEVFMSMAPIEIDWWRRNPLSYNPHMNR
jgi:hypothetical protein